MSTERLPRSSFRIPVISSRHNDDRYLLGQFRHIDRAFARPTRRESSRFRMRFAGSSRQPGCPEKPSPCTTVWISSRARCPRCSPDELGIEADSPVILAIGRLTAQKDHPTFLRSFARARVNHPRAVLVILGIGPLEERTRALVKRSVSTAPCSCQAASRFVTGSTGRTSSCTRQSGRASGWFC